MNFLSIRKSQLKAKSKENINMKHSWKFPSLTTICQFVRHISLPYIYIQPNTLQPTSTEHLRILHHSIMCVTTNITTATTVAVYAPHCTIRWSNVDYVSVMRLIERVELPQGRIVPPHSTAGLINPKINPLTNIDIYLFELQFRFYGWQ